MKQEEWAHRLNARLADHQEPVSHDLWADIEASLPKQSGRQARFIALRRWSVAAAVAAIAIGGGYLWWPQSSSPTDQLAGGSAPTVQQRQESTEDQPLSASTSTASLAVPDHPKEAVSMVSAKPIAAPEPATETEPAVPQESATEEIVSEDHPSSDIRQQGNELPPASAPAVKPSPSTGRHLSFTLYASNGLSGQDSRNAVRMSPQMAALYDYSPTTSMARTRDAIYLANYEEQQHHDQPVSIGLTASYGLSRKFALSTGLVYTHLNSSFTSIMHSSQIQRHQRLDYFGIPLTLQWKAWNHRNLSVYLSAGMEADWNIKADTETEQVNQTMEKDRAQWSVGASVGLQYNILPQVGLYAEPGIRHYFDNGSRVRNFFKDRPTSPSIQIGVRFNR